MVRNTDRIKSLEHELGRFRKKVADQEGELRRLRRECADYLEGARQMNTALDAILAGLALEYGARAETGGWEIAFPMLDVADYARRYVALSRKDEVGGRYVIRVRERRGAETEAERGI